MKKNYWKTDEIIKKQTLIDNSIDECEKVLYKSYMMILGELNTELKGLYYELKKEGDKVLLSHLYQYNRYYDTIDSIQKKLTDLGNIEIDILEERFVNLYEKNMEITSKYGDNNFTVMDSNQVRQVVNEPWGERMKTWSDSIWTHKQATMEIVREDLINFLTTGRSWNDLSRQLAEDMGVDYYKAQRLIRTEMARISVDSSLQECKRLGIDKVRILTSHDGRVCSPECEEHEGMVVSVKTALVGVNVPPFHPNCRCYVIAVMEA